jgi:hypothetical protein
MSARWWNMRTPTCILHGNKNLHSNHRPKTLWRRFEAQVGGKTQCSPRAKKLMVTVQTCNQKANLPVVILSSNMEITDSQKDLVLAPLTLGQLQPSDKGSGRNHSHKCLNRKTCLPHWSWQWTWKLPCNLDPALFGCGTSLHKIPEGDWSTWTSGTGDPIADSKGSLPQSQSLLPQSRNYPKVQTHPYEALGQACQLPFCSRSWRDPISFIPSHCSLGAILPI